MIALDADQLVKMSQAQLDDLFCSSSAGNIPKGEGEGTMIIDPGTELAEEIAQFYHAVIWKGKIFYPEDGELRNKITPLDIETFTAKIYKDTSWFDGREAIIVDYSQTSLINHWIRDEIREVAPGLYLGIVYWNHNKLMNFSLSFPAA